MGQRLRELRNEKGWNQKDVAAKLNMKSNTYGQYETGKHGMSFETLVELSRLFNVSTDYILGASDIKSRASNPWIVDNYNLDILRKNKNGNLYDRSKPKEGVSGKSADAEMSWEEFQTDYLEGLSSPNEYVDKMKDAFKKLEPDEQIQFVIMFLTFTKQSEVDALYQVLTLLLKHDKTKELLIDDICSGSLRRKSYLKIILNKIKGERDQSTENGSNLQK